MGYLGKPIGNELLENSFYCDELNHPMTLPAFCFFDLISEIRSK